MQKFLKKIALYGLGAFLLVNVLAIAVLYGLRKSSFYKPSYVASHYAQKNLDYVVIGSSIGLTTLNTQRIDSLTGLQGFNLSIDDTSLSSNYLMLQHFFAQGKTAKNCILALSYWDADNAQPTLNNNDYRFLPFVNASYVHDYYAEMESGYFKPLTFSQYIPAIGVAYYNTELIVPSLLGMMQPQRKNRFDAHGDYAYPGEGISKNVPFKAVTVSWKNPFIQRIADLCAAHQTRLIVYQAPQYHTQVLMEHRDYRILNHSQYFTEAKYFYDAIHVNYRGRQAATDAVVKAINEGCFQK
jgi:hypothetical protein